MKRALQLGGLSSVNIGVTFLFQWYVLIELGPGVETDALFAGMAVPQIVIAVVSGSLTHVLVPLLAGESEARLRHDAWGLLTLIGGSFGLLAVLLFAGAPMWVPLTVPGFNEVGKALTVEIVRIQLIAMIFTGLNGVQWAVYHAQQRFLWAEFTTMLSSTLALLLLVWALPRFGVTVAAWIGTLRMATQTLLLAPGMGVPVCPDLRSTTIRKAWRRIKPLLLGSAYYKTDPLIDRFLLSTASSGTLSLYYLANQIFSAASRVLNQAIAVPLVPVMSVLHKSGDKIGFKRSYHRKLLQAAAISFTGILVLGFFGRAILGLLVVYGNVSDTYAADLWWIMICLCGLFAGSVMGQVSSCAFYALGDTVTPSRLGIYSYTFSVPAKIACFYFFDVLGLALVTSMFFVVNFILQNNRLRKILERN